MTAQFPEVLILRSTPHALYSTPLEHYLARLPKARRPKFAARSTALRRGYVGTWAIRDGLLWLDALEGWMWQGEEVVEATLARAFPWLNGALKATFMTGELRCPEGAMLTYVHHPFASGFERDRLIDIHKGAVIGERLRLNPPDPVEYWIGPDGSRRRAIIDPDRTEPPPDLYEPGETPRGARYWRQAADELEALPDEEAAAHVAAFTGLGARD